MKLARKLMKSLHAGLPQLLETTTTTIKKDKISKTNFTTNVRVFPMEREGSFGILLVNSAA